MHVLSCLFMADPFPHHRFGCEDLTLQSDILTIWGVFFIYYFPEKTDELDSKSDVCDKGVIYLFPEVNWLFNIEVRMR